MSFETRKSVFIVSVGVVCADCADCSERWRVAGGQSVVKTWMSRTSTALAADAGAEAVAAGAARKILAKASLRYQVPAPRPPPAPLISGGCLSVS